LFGLPLTGLFTQTALNAAFRKLMQKAHPDRDGNPGLAARLNAARDFIRKTKGWT
jgi:DnaJ-domain-containing protein 1